MSKLIRKITVGKDYKNDAMHYAVGQEVYGGHKIIDIIEEEDKYSIDKLLLNLFPLLLNQRYNQGTLL